MNRPNVTGKIVLDSVERWDPCSGLSSFFSPVSVAVIGAGPKPGNQGKNIVESMLAHGFKGKITTVHPKGQEVFNVPAVRSVDELPGGVDLAIAAVSASNVPGLVEPLAKKGVRHLIVISGGFSETGEAGKILQEELRLAGKEFGVRIIGPNGLGVFSAPDCFNSLFLLPGDISLPKPGPIAIISQSGVFLALILDQLAGLGIGVRRAVSFGNRIDVGECDLIEEFARDPAIKVIGLYLESLQDGRRFVDIVRKVTLKKPVVIWKGGQKDRGCDAARAHSASLSGSYAVFQTACSSANMIEVNGYQEFSCALQALALQPPAKGNRVLIVSNGGGMGVFLTDLCEREGFGLPITSDAVIAALQTELPEYYPLKNPIDLTGSGTNEQCVLALDQLLRSGEFDCVLMVLIAGTAGINPEIAGMLKNKLPEDIPVVMAVYGSDMLPRMRESCIHIPVFSSAEEATKALSALIRRSQSQPVSPVVRPAVSLHLPADWADWMNHPRDEMESKLFLQRCGAETPGRHHIESEDDIDRAINRLGFPMILKVVGRDIRHKTEIKGVMLDLPDRESVLKGWQEMSRTWPGRVWAEEQVPPGLDLMAGAHRDPQFGPVLIFGSGGQYVEVYKDIERLLIPATVAEISAMVFKTQAGRVLRGVRGRPACDVSGLLALLSFISEWMDKEPRLESLDLNPVRLCKDRLIVLDAKIVRTHGNEEGESS